MKSKLPITLKSRKEARVQLLNWFSNHRRSKTRDQTLLAFEPDKLVEIFKLISDNPSEVRELLKYVRTHKVSSQHLTAEDFDSVRNIFIAKEVIES